MVETKSFIEINDILTNSEDLKSVIVNIAEVACNLSRIISLGDTCNALNETIGTNSDGDNQRNLDVIADRAYFEKLQNTAVRFYASEEKDKVIEINPDGTLGVAIDPLDGSSNIDTNLSIGSIFSIRKLEEPKKSKDRNWENGFLSPGKKQLAAGYIIFGPQTLMVLTTGKGVQQFVLDRENKHFVLTRKAVEIPEDTREYAVNASNIRHWSKPVKKYIEDSNAGEIGPRGANFNMRWVASLVAETHRILSRGGIFIYPADDRKNYSSGRLRMVYECAPIAYLIEQAGGSATDCINRILDIPAQDLHSRTPFAFGSRNEVARLQAYHDLPDEEISPLFRRRGLFNS